MTTRGGAKGHVVVGVDGSPNSVRALRVAMQEARWRGLGVRAVCVWGHPVQYRMAGPEFAINPATLERSAREALDDAIAAAFGDDTDLAPIERTIVNGSPAESLISASRAADLLVVGSRGRGGFAGLLLGSVSSQVVRHAHCPVLVVRSDDDRSDADRADDHRADADRAEAHGGSSNVR